jgi:hypothetical protein
MERDNKRNPAPVEPTGGTLVRSIEGLGTALTELVARMQAEVTDAGTVTIASANELRQIRLEAERFFLRVRCIATNA